MKKIFGKIADYIRETDKIFFILCITASFYGAVLVLSAIKHTGNFSEFFTQTAAIFLGCVAAVILSTLDYGDYAKFWPVYSILALGLVGLTFIIGIAPEGTDNKAWLLLPGGISLQPAELLKISFIIGFSKHVTGIREEGISPLNVLLLCLHGGAHILLVHLQGDDGTALVFLVMFLAMMLAAGIKARYFIIAGVSAVIAAPIVWFQVLQQYQKDRILLLFSNEIDLQGNGWQQWRGRLAISSGGITGHGLFRGPQVQSGDLPAAKNDFIFAVAGEELGFMGCIAIILLMLFICVRALRVARLSRDKTGMIICTGMFAMVAAQSVINLGMCLSVLPVIGVTLPFFSAGGTSLICLYLGVGLVLSVYAHRHKRTVYLNI